MAAEDPKASFSAGTNLNHLFRGETAVTNIDLRLDVAARMVRQVESEDIEVNERNVNVWGGIQGGIQQTRASRSIVVEGDYDRIIHNNEMLAMGDHIKEVVHGPASEHFKVESEAIMAGGYASLNTLPCKKLMAVADQLCWGGWVEADGVRVEITGVAFRSYIGRQHSTGARVVRGVTYIDDFMSRTEQFSNLNDHQANVVHAGTPASGMHVEL